MIEISNSSWMDCTKNTSFSTDSLIAIFGSSTKEAFFFWEEGEGVSQFQWGGSVINMSPTSQMDPNVLVLNGSKIHSLNI